MLEVLYHHAKFGDARISPAAGAAKTLSFVSVCLSVCPSRFLNVRDCAPDFAMKELVYRDDFDALDRGRLVVVHSCSTFSECCQLATTLNAEIQKTAKLGFSPTEGDRIN